MGFLEGPEEGDLLIGVGEDIFDGLIPQQQTVYCKDKKRWDFDGRAWRQCQCEGERIGQQPIVIVDVVPHVLVFGDGLSLIVASE